MNSYLFLRRMRGPIFLLTFGVTAILDVYTSIDYTRSWPLYIIVWGVLSLAENAILTQNPPTPPGSPGYGPYPGGYPGTYQGPYQGYAPGQQGGANTGTNTGTGTGTASTAIVPSPGDEGR
jgi:hypothetical protein